MTKTHVALEAVEIALAAIEDEITAHAPRPGAAPVNLQQLRTFRSNLQTLRDQLMSGRVPPRGQRLTGMGRMITDSWPFDSQLGQTLLNAEQHYLDL
ncbi:hypothetical protein [Streptacidiphilus jiangxiensis]|uniref:Uncharacterized protein n=1 Tax=Streptacidiphilus jiangxiensis TaxID=235985 RepID=A0A1H7PE49_STRJI|nr:hypothetical protein [Streptacidiphilus jiangxiensis]SEL33357.1 hypothetical protein SAMN05414137_107318 [Streptacidiphilus jiangxiensis]